VLGAALGVPDNVALAILGGPGSVGAGHVLAWNEHLDPVIGFGYGSTLLHFLPDAVVQVLTRLIVR